MRRTRSERLDATRAPIANGTYSTAHPPCSLGNLNLDRVLIGLYRPPAFEGRSSSLEVLHCTLAQLHFHPLETFGQHRLFSIIEHFVADPKEDVVLLLD